MPAIYGRIPISVPKARNIMPKWPRTAWCFCGFDRRATIRPVLVWFIMWRNWRLRACLALLTATLALFLVADRAPTQTTAPPPAPPGLEKIQHFVFIMQENRSFDHYFGTYPGVEGTPPGVCIPDPAGGPCVAPYHDANLVNRGGAHNWANALNCLDGGKMDGFLAGAVQS